MNQARLNEKAAPPPAPKGNKDNARDIHNKKNLAAQLLCALRATLQLVDIPVDALPRGRAVI
jgi:hypothetical protein